MRLTQRDNVGSVERRNQSPNYLIDPDGLVRYGHFWLYPPLRRLSTKTGVGRRADCNYADNCNDCYPVIFKSLDFV